MYTVEYYEYDWDQNLVAHGTFECEDKRRAWQHFSTSIAEHYYGKDFWDDFTWDERVVESIHSDEAGYNSCVLRKWEGFDDDITLAWKYGDVRYKSLQELWDAVPEFKGYGKTMDRPFIYINDNTVAELDIVDNWQKRAHTDCNDPEPSPDLPF